MTEINPVLFYIFAGMALGFSLMTVLKKNPVASAFSLVLAFFSFAGIYALLSAHLIATLQVLVYAGAIMVLFIFVVMLLNSDTPSLDFGRTHAVFKVMAALVSLALLVVFVYVFKHAPVPSAVGAFTVEAVAKAGGNTQVISELMFSEYVLPVELTSVLLVAAIVGAVALAKRHSRHAAVSHKKGAVDVTSGR